VSQIDDILTMVRDQANLSDVDAKYSDDKLLTYIKRAYTLVSEEIQGLDRSHVIARIDLTCEADTQEYILPPHIGRILKLGEIEDTYDTYKWVVTPLSNFNPAGPGVTIEGNVLRFQPKLSADVTLRMEFIPNGDVQFHEGSVTQNEGGTAVTSSGITLDSSPTVGSFDTRVNAYTGSFIRVLDSSIETASTGCSVTEERTITSYNYSTKVATVTPAWTALSPTNTKVVVYEVVPLLTDFLAHAVALSAAISILGPEGKKARYNGCTLEYARVMRTLRNRATRKQSMTKPHMDRTQGIQWAVRVR